MSAVLEHELNTSPKTQATSIEDGKRRIREVARILAQGAIRAAIAERGTTGNPTEDDAVEGNPS